MYVPGYVCSKYEILAFGRKVKSCSRVDDVVVVGQVTVKGVIRS